MFNLRSTLYRKPSGCTSNNARDSLLHFTVSFVGIRNLRNSPYLLYIDEQNFRFARCLIRLIRIHLK